MAPPDSDRCVAAWEAAIDRLERDPPRGVVLHLRGPWPLSPAQDLEALAAAEPGAAAGLAAVERVDRARRALERWRALPVVTVALLENSGALPGALEIGLACDVRVAVESPGSRLRLGVFEVSWGAVPVLGATWAVPARSGLAAGLGFLLAGRGLTARAALAAGWVDEVVPAESARRAAARWIGDPSARRTSARRAAPAPGWRPGWHRWRERLLAPWIVRAARRRLDTVAEPLRAAPLAVLEAVAAGWTAGPAAALAVERRRFADLVTGEGGAVRPLARLASVTRGASAERAPGAGAAGLAVGILGSGFMGSGIAGAALVAGHRVRLFDRRPEALAATLRALAGGEIAGGRAPGPARRPSAPPTATLEPLGFAGSDVVIEAIAEDLDAKRALLREIEAQLGASALLASNTSTLPIAALAHGLRHPNRMLGLHFFSPVRRMPLVEVVRPATAAEPFVARAVEFVRSLGKLPVVVRDGPGFYTTRILAPYLAQAVSLVAEGQAIARVDGAARAAGFPVGPLELLDEVGLDVATRAAETMAAAFPDRFPAAREFRQLVEQGRLGRKVGQGFYDYKARRRGGRKVPDDRVLDLLARDTQAAAPLSDPAIAERLLLALVAEALRCLEEGVIASPEDGDVAAVLGIGFPPHRGGPFAYAAARGREAVRQDLRRLGERLGPAFWPL